MLRPSAVLHIGYNVTPRISLCRHCLPIMLTRSSPVFVSSIQGQECLQAANSLARSAFTRQSSSVARKYKRYWASDKKYTKEAEVLHKGVFRGLNEARALHKPEGWTKELEEFSRQPYESGTDLRTESPLQKFQAATSFAEDFVPSSAEERSSNTASTSAPTAVPRKKGVTDGVWDKRDEEAMAEALMDKQNSNKRGPVKALLGKSEIELRAIANALGFRGYYGLHMYQGLLHGVSSCDKFAFIPKDLRQALVDAGYSTGRSRIVDTVAATDGTKKLLLQLHDGRIVETVGIPNDKDGRLTICVSSQVGCPMRCTFCATGKGGFARNLQPHEIVDQVMTVQEQYKERVSNIVFMGMGEPLLTMRSVLAAVDFMVKDMTIGARRITISTVGVPNALMKLASHKLQCTLAVSIHAPTQALREQIVPSAKMYPLEALMMDCHKYFQTTSRRLTLEYTLLEGVNDELEQAQQLAKLMKRFKMMAHVNLIPYNPVDGSQFVRPSRNRVMRFSETLTREGVVNSIRITKGLEASAACGQLRNQYQKTPLPEYAALN